MKPSVHQQSFLYLFLLMWTIVLSASNGFHPSSIALAGKRSTTAGSHTGETFLSMASTAKPRKKGYVPKWKKKKTLADEAGGPKDYNEIGLIGNIPVTFVQGNETKSTMALPGQPLRDVASQAGQFIKYGCGKGECGTCECLVDGKYVRPCVAVVPSALEEGREFYGPVQVKQVKAKSTSSGKFYSVRSFFMGFWNNLLGMVGMVTYRRAAKKNWKERQEYEDLIKQKTLEKKLARLAAAEQQQQQQQNQKLSP